MLWLPARRQLFDAASFGRACRAVADRVAGLRGRGAAFAAAGGDRRGGGCEPGDRDPLPRRKRDAGRDVAAVATAARDRLRVRKLPDFILASRLLRSSLVIR